ncbi:MAG: exosortase [Pseudomonadota bacterium]
MADMPLQLSNLKFISWVHRLGWHPLYLAILLSTLVLSFRPGTENLIHHWLRNDTYSHGLLLGPLTLVLILQAMAARSVGRFDALSLGVSVLLAAALAIGQLLGMVIVFQAVAPILLLSLLVSVYGRNALMPFAIPVLLFYYSLPIWDLINPALQSLTVLAVSQLVFWTGLAAFVDGNQVTVSSGIFEIAAGCSGLRFFIISAAVATLYNYLYVASVRDSLVLLALAMGLAVVGNWIRVVVVIQMGIRLGIDHPQVVDHAFVGWLVFVVTMLVWFWVAGKVPEQVRESKAKALPVPGAGRLLLAIGACAVTASIALVLESRVTQSVQPPSLADSSISRSQACGAWRSDHRSETLEQRGAFEWQGHPMCVDLIWYESQSTRAPAFASSNERAANAVGRYATVDSFSLNRGVQLTVVTEPSGDGVWFAERRFVGRVMARSAFRERWLRLQQLLMGRLDTTVVMIAQRCDVNCRAAIRSGALPLDVDAALQAVEQQLVLQK